MQLQTCRLLYAMFQQKIDQFFWYINQAVTELAIQNTVARNVLVLYVDIFMMF